MKIILDFIIPRRPVSFQTSNKENKRLWMEFVTECAKKEWQGQIDKNIFYKFLIVYLCRDYPPDINNIIKPIEDALIGLVYPDDNKVLDVEGHTRYLSDGINLVNLPDKLKKAAYDGKESVYVQISIIDKKELNL